MKLFNHKAVCGSFENPIIGLPTEAEDLWYIHINRMSDGMAPVLTYRNSTTGYLVNMFDSPDQLETPVDFDEPCTYKVLRSARSLEDEGSEAPEYIVSLKIEYGFDHKETLRQILTDIQNGKELIVEV